MAVGAVAGTKLYIGTTDATPSPDEWVEIKDIANLGNIQQQFNAITVESVGDGDSYDIKGTRRYPNFELTLNRNDEDAGQIALKAAAEASRGTLYNFRILEGDGGYVTWRGEVFGYGPNYGGVNALKQIQTSISIKPDTIDMELA